MPGIVVGTGIAAAGATIVNSKPAMDAIHSAENKVASLISPSTGPLSNPLAHAISTNFNVIRSQSSTTKSMQQNISHPVVPTVSLLG